MLEGRILALSGDRAVMFNRVPSGRIWELRSADDGRTWSEPKPTTLVHPDAPPMISKLANDRTLIAFIHNRPAGHRHRNVQYHDRRELWFSLSNDEGITWSDPRFILADAAEPGNWVEVSYADLIADGEDLHLFLDHQKRQILHFHFTENDLSLMPSRAEMSSITT